MSDAEQARDAGISQVLANSPDEFKDGVRTYIASLKPGWTGTGEEIRRACQGLGYVAHHPNCWGASINAAIRRGHLATTGQWRKPTSKVSHARQTQILTRTEAP